MCLLFETIKIVDGTAENLSLHQARFDLSRKQHFIDCEKLQLNEIIKCPADLASGVTKCKLIYNEEVRDIHYEVYRARPAKKFKLMYYDEIDYAYKYLDRSVIDMLLNRKKNGDDIIIVKNGFITDTSYANLVFKDGNKLFTPAHALLQGTKRQKYIALGILEETDISTGDISLFSHFKRINAMLDLDDSPWIPIGNLIP